MKVVGFDVGKDSLFAARIDRSGQVKDHYEVENNTEAITRLLTQLRAKYKNLVASGATGDYHRPLALSCLALGIPFKLLNPVPPNSTCGLRYGNERPMLKLLPEWLCKVRVRHDVAD
jgi:transposase